MFTDCPTYTINLDQSPENRWDHIIPHFKDKIPLATKIADEMLGAGAPIAITMLGMAHSMGKVAYAQELQGIANATGMKVGKVLLLQLVYEAFAACTSVIINNKNHPIHIRTMDWDLPILKKLTIQLKFQRNGKTVFSGTTWAGYIGILTGMRARAFSVSINYRSTDKTCLLPRIKAFSSNIIRCILGHWPIGYLIRDTLDGNLNYKKAVEVFSTSELISPTYITVCGTRKDQGTIITRNRSAQDYHNGNICTNLADGPLIQANMDHWRETVFTSKNTPRQRWMDICESKERRAFVAEAINDECNCEAQTLAIIMASEPCYSTELTIYTSLMIPAASLMNTWTRRKRKWKTKGNFAYGKIRKKCKKRYEDAITV